MTHRSDPLHTLQTVVGVVLGVLVVAGGTVLLGTVLGVSSVPGVTSEVCVTTSPDHGVGFRTGAGDETGPPAVGPVDLRPQVEWHAESIRLCDPAPAPATRALGAVAVAVWWAAPVVFFGLLWRVLLRARREGVFRDRVAGGLRLLGSFLLVWAAVGFLGTGLVDAALINRMTAGDDVMLFVSGPLPWLTVLLGLGLLAVGRVVDQGVVLREDSEATI